MAGDISVVHEIPLKVLASISPSVPLHLDAATYSVCDVPIPRAKRATVYLTDCGVTIFSCPVLVSKFPTSPASVLQKSLATYQKIDGELGSCMTSVTAPE